MKKQVKNTHKEFKAELLKDPEFRREYDALKPEYDIITIRLRKAMANANKADRDFTPLAKNLTPEKLKKLQKSVKGG